MKSYDASTDLEDHLFAFLTHMCPQTATNAIRCKTFSMFLEGRTRQWFQRLPPRSIRSFGQLALLFTIQFVSSRIFSKNIAYLMVVHKKSEKSLREYMVRFNNESLQIRNRNDNAIIAASLTGCMYNSYIRNSLKNLLSLLDRAHEMANVEKIDRLKSEQEKLKDERSKKKIDLIDMQGSLSQKNIFDWLLRDRTLEGERGWTPLTTPKVQILTIMKVEGLSRPLKKLSDSKNKRN